MTAVVFKIKTNLQLMMKRLFGVEDDDTEYWTLLFEQRILNRHVGFTVLSRRSEVADTLLEMESAIRELSKDHDPDMHANFGFDEEFDDPEAPSQNADGDYNWNRPISPESEENSSNKRRASTNSSESSEELDFLPDEQTDVTATAYEYAFNGDEGVYNEESLPTEFQMDSEVKASDRGHVSGHDDGDHLEEKKTNRTPHAETLSVHLKSARDNRKATRSPGNTIHFEMDEFHSNCSSERSRAADELRPGSTSSQSIGASEMDVNVNLHKAEDPHQGERPKTLTFDEANLVSSSVDPQSTSVGRVPDEVLMLNAKEKPVSKFTSFLIRTKNRIASSLFEDVSPFDSSKSIHAARMRGMNMTLLRAGNFKEAPKRPVDTSKDPKNFEEFLEGIRFDLDANDPKSREQNPCVKFQNYLGLKSRPIPKHPYRGGTISTFMAELRRCTRFCLALCHCVHSDQSKPKHRPSLSILLKISKTKTKISSHESSNYLTGVAAYKMYKILVSIEAKCLVDDLLKEREMFLKHFKWKHDWLKHIITLARDYYQNPTNSKRHEWKELKKCLSEEHMSDTDLRYNVTHIPLYTPVFTGLVMLAQILFMVVVLAVYGVAPFHPRDAFHDHVNATGFSSGMTLTHRANLNFNPWLGPVDRSLVDAGAAYGPCLQKRLFEGRREMSYYMPPTLNHYGCCQVDTPHCVYGTLTRDECYHVAKGNASWKEGSMCSELPVSNASRCTAIKPCCTGISGHCRMVSRELCHEDDSVFHSECDHCASVNCVRELCHLSFLDNPLRTDDKEPWRLKDFGWKQKHRIVFSLVSSDGLISLAPVLLLEAFFMRRLELYIGWHRVAIIYVISSLAGMMSQLAFEKPQPVTGSLGGALGVFGVVILELSQAWNLVPRPWLELLKLGSILLFFFFLGTMPRISFNAIFAGLVTGIISGLMVVPYMNFNVYLGAFRGRLVVVSLVLLSHTFTSLCIFAFYINGSPICKWCGQVDCVDYLQEGLCRSYEHHGDHYHLTNKLQ